MSKLLRLPFALLAVLALFLLSPGIAAADTTPPPDDCSTTPSGCDTTAGDVTDGTVSETPTDTVEPTDVVPPAAPDGNDDSAEQATGVMDDVAAGVAANQPEAAAQGTDGDTTGTERGSGTTPQDDQTGDQPDPAAVGECIGAVVQQLITDLQAALGAGVDGLIAEIQDAVADPTTLPAFLEGLPAMGDDTVSGITEEGQALLTKAGEDIQACIPAPPTGGPTNPTPPPTDEPPTSQPVSNVGTPPQAVTPTATQPTTTQPTQTLAYTGVDVWALVRLSLILVSGGTLILLAGVRRQA